MTDQSTVRVAITVDGEERGAAALSEGVFGRFGEHLGSAMYPGVYEDYLSNGCFEVWNEGGGYGAGLTFTDVPDHEGVAYPWEPVGGAALERPTGGVRGRVRDEAIESGEGIPEGNRPTPAGVRAGRCQRLVVDGEGGVGQRVALPDRRTTAFDVAVSVRGTLSDASVCLRAGVEGEVLGRATVPVGAEWERREVTVALDETSPERFGDGAYGEYALTVEAAGEGRVDLDWATLVPVDAVEGKFNPTTVERLREFEVSGIRWPGGNYASQYRWRHGVGPVAERPVVPILNWGGLERNALGTNEWLRFCELADVEPYVTVPFWSAAGPEEAAAWVEYVNGSADTEMGALRADHGYPDPWDVTWWNVGNETWGTWQVGRTDAAGYAEGYVAYREAMREADPDVEIDAVGVDPWFTLVDDGPAADPDQSAPPVWNDVLFERAGDAVEGLDVHRYTEGISGHTSEAGERKAWLDAAGEDPTGYAEVLVNDPGAWDDLLSEVRATAAADGVEDLRLTVGEWGLRANETNEGWPRPGRGTMAHAVFAARALQAFARHADAVEHAHWTDFSLYAQPRPRGASGSHPAAHVFRRVAERVRGEAAWYPVETRVTDAPTRTRPRTGVSILAGEDVPLVDAVTLGTADGRTLTLLVNGSLRESAAVAVALGADGPTSVEVYADDGGDPFAEQGGDVAPERRTVASGPVELSLPPASVALLAHGGA